jgi:hypothetical protein
MKHGMQCTSMLLLVEAGGVPCRRLSRSIVLSTSTARASHHAPRILHRRTSSVPNVFGLAPAKAGASSQPTNLPEPSP